MEIALVYVFGAVTVIMMLLADCSKDDSYAYKTYMVLACTFGVPFLLGGFTLVAIELVRI